MILDSFQGATLDKHSGGFLMESEYSYRTLSERDEAAVKLLVKNAFPRFLWGDYWEWKYSRNPGFDPSMVAVAERNAKIIGCNHWLIRDFKLSGSLATKAILCADIAVDADHRKQGIGKSLLLFLRSTGIFKEKRAVLNYMFANPELSKRLYRPVIGYIPIPTSTVTYTKRLNWKKITQKTDEMNEKTDLSSSVNGRMNKLKSKISLRVSGAPPLTITISCGRIEANEGNAKDADVKVESDLATLTSFQERKNRMRRLFKALITGKLKIIGSPLGIYRFYRNLNLIEKIFVES